MGGQPITSFGLMMLLAFAAAGYVHRVQMREAGAEADVTWDLLFMAIVGGILGAKLNYLFLNFPRLVEFFRAKDDRFFGFLTPAQVISLVLVLVGLAGMAKLRGPQRASEPAPLEV